jgi:hypothetical protein
MLLLDLDVFTGILIGEAFFVEILVGRAPF